MSDPTRLRDQGDGPPELRRALEALGKEGGDPARLARVAERLGPLLDAAPPAMPASAWARALIRAQLHGGKLLVAGVAIGTAAWFGLSTQQTKSVERPVAREVTNEVAASAQPAPVTAPAVVPPPAPSLPEEPAQLAAQGPAPRAKRPTNPAKTRAGSTSSPAQISPQSAAATARSGADSTQTDTPTRAQDQAAPAPKAPPAEPEPPVRVPGEAQLLMDARKAMADDPKAALRLLDQHAAQYAKGLLAPEREVLAIQALRLLHQDGAAQQRLERFRARYPDSLHLKRLERQTP